MPGGSDRRVLVAAASPTSLTALEELAARNGRAVALAVTVEEIHLLDEAPLPIPCELLADSAAFEEIRVRCPTVLDRVREVRLYGIYQSPTGALSVAVTDPYQEPLSGWWAVARRVLDVAGAVIGLAATAPLLALAAIAIRVESPGGVLFHQTRLGRHGRPFTLHKLRTMHTGRSDHEHRAYIAALINDEADTHDGIYKLTRDPRITRVGAVLRRFSVDELPQLWNVLRGDMSLLGPRPDLPSTMRQCTGYTWLRMRVRPGLTGLWQVSGRCEIPFRPMIDLDNRYCAEVGPRLDAAILARTPVTLLRGTGSA